MNSDERPRMLLAAQPLWPLEVSADDRLDPLYVHLPGAVLEIHPSDLLDPAVTDCLFHVGATVDQEGDRVGVVYHERPLAIACRKTIDDAAMYVVVELPDGGGVAWTWEQVEALLARRFAYLDWQDH